MSQHTYVRVFWDHQSAADPFELWSELDGDRFEIRKLEYFRDGAIGSASEAEEIGSTSLGKVPVPALAEIASDAQFRPHEATREEFEARWRGRLKHST